MANIKLKLTSSSRISKVWIDGVAVRFDNNGEVAKSLNEGQMHAIQWIFRGAPSDTYSIEIKEPSYVAAKIVDNEIIGSDLLGCGYHKFIL